MAGLIAPQPGTGYAIPDKVTDLKSFFNLLGWFIIIIGFLNLLPIPRLDLGNALISIIETKRKTKFNPKRMRIVRYVCFGIFSVMVIFFFIY
jgi:membrane-associated protease RseP (regulator of RpoE activity)